MLGKWSAHRCPSVAFPTHETGSQHTRSACACSDGNGASRREGDSGPPSPLLSDPAVRRGPRAGSLSGAGCLGAGEGLGELLPRGLGGSAPPSARALPAPFRDRTPSVAGRPRLQLQRHGSVGTAAGGGVLPLVSQPLFSEREGLCDVTLFLNVGKALSVGSGSWHSGQGGRESGPSAPAAGTEPG